MLFCQFVLQKKLGPREIPFKIRNLAHQLYNLPKRNIYKKPVDFFSLLEDDFLVQLLFSDVLNSPLTYSVFFTKNTIFAQKTKQK